MQIPAAQVIRGYAQQAETENEYIAEQLYELADTFEGAVTDSDRRVERDDHFVLRTKLSNTISQLPTNDTFFEDVGDLLTSLKVGMEQAVDSSALTFRAYVPMIENGAVQLQWIGDEVTLGDRPGLFRAPEHFATYIPTKQLEQVFGDRYTRATMLIDQAESIELGDGADDYLFGDRELFDRVTNETVNFSQVYDDYKRQMFLQSTLSIGTFNEEDPQQLAAMSLIQEAVLPITELDLHAPDYLNDHVSNIPCVRVIWLLAQNLVEKGVLEPEKLEVWLTNPDDPAVIQEAANELAEYLDVVEFRAYNDYHQSFSGDTWETGGLTYMLQHGVLALSHNKNLKQRLPDYTKRDPDHHARVVVRSPTGPMMLLFDGPIEELSVADEHTYYPPRAMHTFGVTNLNFQLDSEVEIQATDVAQTSDIVIPSFEQLQEMEDRFINTIKDVRADEVDTADEQQVISTLIDQLDEALDVNEQQLRELELQKAQIQFGSHVENRREQLRAINTQIDGLERWVQLAKNIHGGSRLAIRFLRDDSEQLLPDYLMQQFLHQVNQIPRHNDPSQSNWRQEIRELIHIEEGIKTTYLHSRLSAVTVDQDLRNFDLGWATNIFHKCAFLDFITFWDGTTSDRGYVYRAGRAEKQDQFDLTEQYVPVVQAANTSVTDEIHLLLLAENPINPAGNDYRTNFAKYELLKPAYDQLVLVYDTARDAEYSLRRAESAIIHRNIVRMQEPPMFIQVMHTDSEGDVSYSTELNPAYVMWESEYHAAKRAAAYWCERASRSVNRVNEERPKLQAELERAGITDHFNEHLDSRINWWFSGWINFGYWSYDSSQVDDIQHDLNRLIDGLDQISQIVGPEYGKYRSRVEDTRRETRQELAESDGASNW